MAGPTTEVLNDDLKALGAENCRISDRLTEEIHAVDNRVVGLAAQFGIAKWLIAGSLGASISGVGFGIWWAGNSNARFDALEKRADKFEARTEARFDRLEAMIAKVLEQTKPPAKP